jgi:hypothetical protein
MPIAKCQVPIAAGTLALIMQMAAAQESATPTPTPSASPSRSVRISFVPPPMDGTISLGIYNSDQKLVRVLVEEGDLDEFDIGADALIVKWDGKNDREEDLPAGKYHARGYLVGALKVEDLGKGEIPQAKSNATDHVQVKLVSNPLSNGAKAIADLAMGFDEDGCYMKTTDGLPLFTVSETPNLVRALIAKTGEKSVNVWQDDGATIQQFRISNIDQMIAFDCGDFELK